MPDIFMLSEAVLSQMSSEREQKYRVLHSYDSLNTEIVALTSALCKYKCISFTVHISKILDQNTNTYAF